MAITSIDLNTAQGRAAARAEGLPVPPDNFESIAAVRKRVDENDEFLPDVIDLARANGWLAAHFRAAKTDRGWRTAVQADGKGFFDLVLVRDRVVYAELKSENGKLSSDQEKWYAALLKSGQEAYVWRPSERAEIERILK